MIVLPGWLWDAQQVWRCIFFMLTITSVLTWKWAFRTARAWIAGE